MIWLNRYTMPDSGNPLWERVHSHHGRAVVTDGRCLLAVDSPTASFAPLAESCAPRLPGARVDLAQVASFLDAPAPPGAETTTLSDLWLWLDRLERIQCPACRHARAGDPEREFCSDCDGTGWVFPWANEPDEYTGVVSGVKLDRQRVCWWLAGELDGFGPAVRFWAHPTPTVAKSPTVAFDGGRWRLFVMGLDPADHPGRYRTYYPGAGLWWHLRGDPISRLVAADWYADRGVEPVNLFAGADQ